MTLIGPPMHLTQQQQLNQMCPPPLGPPATWFMNHPQPTGLPPSSVSYNGYHQNYYNNHGPLQAPSLHQTISATTHLSSSPGNNTHQQQTNHILHRHNHVTQSIQQQQQQQAQQQASQYNQYTYQQAPIQQQTQPQQQQQQQQLLHHQQQPQQQQQYNPQLQHQQPLAIQQPQSQHVHSQQPSPILHQQTQSHQAQLSPHANQPSRPSPTLLQHQQPSPGYQQGSPLNSHLTSPSLQPSLQPSPVLASHHQSQSQQPSPHGRLQPTPTPPHHTPTPNSQHSIRPASVKEITNSTHHQLSNILQTEIRILELNRRLQSRPSTFNKSNPLPSHDLYDDSTWWEEFTNDFFRDDATLTLIVQIDEKPIKYILRRALIPRFFRSYFDGGVTELSINLRNSKEFRSSQTIMLDCEHANIVSKNILRHPKISSAPRVVVCTKGHLSIEFSVGHLDSLLIKSWKFRTNVCREYIDRSITTIGLPNTLLVEPITFQGIPNSTISYLKMCSILEPMQELMSQHKSTKIEPRTCLKRLLFERYRYTSEVETKSTTSKRRRRKPPTSPTIQTKATTTNNKRSKTSPNSSNNSVASASPPSETSIPPPTLNIMVVGEPTFMGEYCDDNERVITKIENANQAPVIEAQISCNSTNQQNDKVDYKSDIKEPIEEVESASEQYLEPVNNIGETTNQTIQPELVEQARLETKDDIVNDTEKQSIVAVEEKQVASLIDDIKNQPLDELVEKENNNSLIYDESQTNSTATQSDHLYNTMSSIPEDREDDFKASLGDLLVSKPPPTTNNKSIISSNGSNNKQNRRRSSERKETLREGLMRTSDFVVAMKDLKCEHPALWRITTGNNLLQQFEPKTQNGIVLYENTNQYAGWNPDIKRDYVGVDVKLTQHTRNQITVERLLLNFQKLEDTESFHDKHFVIYLQILISTALDPKFWESIENEPKHHDYFLTSRRIIEDIVKRYKLKLSNKLKLSEAILKNVEKYPNLLVKSILNGEGEQMCRACNTNHSTHMVTFGNRSYDLHSYKPVKVTSEPSKIDDKGLNVHLCESCLDIMKLYSEIHHIGWKFFNIAREKVEAHRTKGKPINAILDECLKDEDWMAMIYTERDALWTKIDNVS